MKKHDNDGRDRSRTHAVVEVLRERDDVAMMKAQCRRLFLIKQMSTHEGEQETEERCSFKINNAHNETDMLSSLLEIMNETGVRVKIKNLASLSVERVSHSRKCIDIDKSIKGATRRLSVIHKHADQGSNLMSSVAESVQVVGLVAPGTSDVAGKAALELDVVESQKRKWATDIANRINSIISTIEVPLVSNKEIEVSRRILSVSNNTNNDFDWDMISQTTSAKSSWMNMRRVEDQHGQGNESQENDNNHSGSRFVGHNSLYNGEREYNGHAPSPPTISSSDSKSGKKTSVTSTEHSHHTTATTTNSNFYRRSIVAKYCPNGAPADCRTPLDQLHIPYTFRNLLKALISIQSPSLTSSTSSSSSSNSLRMRPEYPLPPLRSWTSIGLAFKTRNRESIYTQFKDSMGVQIRQCGIDDDNMTLQKYGSMQKMSNRKHSNKAVADQQSTYINRGSDTMVHESLVFASLCMDEAESIIREGCIAKCKSFLCHGVPHCEHRFHLWKLALGHLHSEADFKQGLRSPDSVIFSKLCTSIDEVEMTYIDGAVCGEVNRMANDDEYFIFAEQMRLALLCFMRDERVYDICKQLNNVPHPILTMKACNVNTQKGKKSPPTFSRQYLYPPSGKSLYQLFQTPSFSVFHFDNDNNNNTWVMFLSVSVFICYSKFGLVITWYLLCIYYHCFWFQYHE